MKIDFDQQIMTLEGNPLFEWEELTNDDSTPQRNERGDIIRKKKVLSLGIMCNRALLNIYQEDEKNSEDKLTRWELAKKIKANKLPMSIEDVAMIRKYVKKSFPVHVVGPIFDLLDSSANGANKGG